MSEASQALQKIARGTGIVFAGTVISMFFGFLSRAIIARYFSTAEYGVFNLALTVLSIALVIATLGFQNALPREIAFYREREPSRVGELVSTALVIVALNSVIWTVILFAGAGSISRLFGDERLVRALRIVVFALPFWALTGVIISVSRGFGRVRERVYFQNVMYPTLFLVFVLSGVILNLNFVYVFFAYIAAQVLTLLALTFDVWKTMLFEFTASLDLKLGKELVRFSIPLMFTGIIIFIMTWTDTLMLGYYKGSDFVGLYNTAAPLARLLSIFLDSVSFIYSPIVSQLYINGKIDEMKRTYQIVTKWIFLLTLPLFSAIFLFPEAIITFFFGSKYVLASSALQILALGFMFHASLGSNWLSLIVIGENDFIMKSSFISAVFNVILNTALIPSWGITGAAVATATSYVLGNIMYSLKLYKKTRIHPFGWNYIKLLGIGSMLLGTIWHLHLKISVIWHVVLMLIGLVSLYFLLMLLSRSIDKEDIELVLSIEKKVGVDLRVVRNILGKFI